MGTELSLNLLQNYLTPEQFSVRADKFKDYFIPQAGAFTSNPPDIVSYTFLKDLQPDTSQLQNYTFFTVLRIIYGLDVATNKVKLFYLPDVAKQADPGSQTFNFQKDIRADRPHLFHYVNSNVLQSISYAEAETFINNYLSQMQRVDTNGNLPISTGDTHMDDARGITITYQVIDHYFENINIHFYNIAEYYDRVAGVEKHKHVVALSSHPPGYADAICANLGALCPPRCKELQIVGLTRVEPEFMGLERYRIAAKMVDIDKMTRSKSQIEYFFK